VLLIDTV